MKLPNTYFENLSAARYREYLKLLPNMTQASSKAVTMAIFTLLALSLFGIFAIEPTLSTIIGLKKQLADSQYVKTQLTTKINNLSQLQQQYTVFTPQLPVLLNAIPQTPQVTQLTGQVASIAQQAGVTITSFRINQVQLTQNQIPVDSVSSYVFYIEAQGDYPSIDRFLSGLTDFDRVVTIDSISINQDQNINTLDLLVQARAFFK